ncbi:MAG: hypothetical protein IJ040_00840 [Lachnospiraceae bacterium]|nr:hypothetical protein [Lachnospiraceae bacterium]
MSLFAKPEYVEMQLPFTIVTFPEDWEACIIGIEAYGAVLDRMQYYYSCFGANPNYYDELLEVMKNCADKRINIQFKIKNGKIKNYKMDIDSLADAYQDERIRKLELLSWGCKDKSALQIEKER